MPGKLRFFGFHDIPESEVHIRDRRSKRIERVCAGGRAADRANPYGHNTDLVLKKMKKLRGPGNRDVDILDYRFALHAKQRINTLRNFPAAVPAHYLGIS